MALKKVVLGTLVVVAAAVGGWFSLDKETRGLLATVPTNRDLLFWTQPQRDAAFRALTASRCWPRPTWCPPAARHHPCPQGRP